MSRIFKEYKKIKKIFETKDVSFTDLIIDLRPIDDSDLYNWLAIIRGPAETPYEGNPINLVIQIPQDYPFSPPVLHFEAGKMPHCNVSFQTGEICLDILTKQHWSPAWDLLHVLKAIEQLLREPVPESPLNIDIANILKERDMGAYYGLVKYYFANAV